jgi:hypothetical protein
MRSTIFASFVDNAAAEKAAGALLDHGLSNDDISIVAQRDGDIQVAKSEPPRVEYNETNTEYRDPVDPSLAETTGTSYGHAIVNDMGRPTTAQEAFSLPGDVAYGATMAGGIESNDPMTHYRGGERPYDDDDGAPTLKNEPTFGQVQQTTPPPVPVEHTSTAEEREDVTAKHGISTTTAADAGEGAVKGAAIGLGVGIAAALAAVFLPGIGLVVGGGAMAAALAGAAGTVGAGAIAGGVTGYLKDQGVPEESLTVYRDAYEHGGAVLGVHVPPEQNRADVEAILAKYGAQNIEMYGAVRSA